MAHADLVGQVIDNKYRVEALLGRGGMGAVFRAIHLGTDRIVALKVIASAFADQPEYLERFSREARACGRLRHPGIVDVTDFGVATHHDEHLAYLVMEYLDGQTLADALRDNPTPPLPWVIDVLEQVCSAVEEAHSHGILHRDLKPENVWLEPDRRGGYSVKVLDFGLAKLDGPEPEGQQLGAIHAQRLAATTDETGDFATMAGTIDRTVAPQTGGAATSVSGTPAYMSPEQTRGESVTPRSDVYSLGVIAYRMIAGRLPFEGSVREVLAAQLEKEAPSLKTIRPDVHDDAARLVASALSKNPAERPASAGMFGNMLAAQLEPAIGVLPPRNPSIHRPARRLSPAWRTGVRAGAHSQCAAGRLGTRSRGRSRRNAKGGVGGANDSLLCICICRAGCARCHADGDPTNARRTSPILGSGGPMARTLGAAASVGACHRADLLSDSGIDRVDAGRRVRDSLAQPQPARIAPLGAPADSSVSRAAAVSPPIAVLKYYGLTIRQTGFLAAVILIAGLSFNAATRRSAELTQRSGDLRAATQKWYLAVFMVSAGLFGVVIGMLGGRRATSLFVVSMPLLSIAMLLIFTVNALFGALMYLSARRATGESLERISADFEQETASRTRPREAEVRR